MNSISSVEYNYYYCGFWKSL